MLNFKLKRRHEPRSWSGHFERSRGFDVGSLNRAARFARFSRSAVTPASVTLRADVAAPDERNVLCFRWFDRAVAGAFLLAVQRDAPLGSKKIIDFIRRQFDLITDGNEFGVGIEGRIPFKKITL